MNIPALIGTAFFTIFITGCDLSINTASGSNISSISTSSGSYSEVSFVGSNGVYRVGTDVIEARNGVLKLNGVPHGTVNNRSVVKYTARGDNKTLYVDGAVRGPVQ